MEMPLGQRIRGLPGPLLITGHTGFKGTWMTFLLEHLNVPVVGYSLPAEKDSLFDRAERTGAIPEVFADIRDYVALEKFIDLHRPSTIIHMAAQPLVLKSYENPRETFDVNVMGTVNVLDIAFKKDFVKAIIVVTTDKVYRNDNSARAFVETDPLEGKDPYSASKVGTEAVVGAWQQLSAASGGPAVVSVRAGNVIGGGDFAEDRLIPDLVRGGGGFVAENLVTIRNPESIRPWQHVLDPLRGYLLALEFVLKGNRIDHLNFGPKDQLQLSVREVVNIFNSSFQASANDEYTITTIEIKSSTGLEAKNLTIDSTKSKQILNWESMWSIQMAVQRTGNWWGRIVSGNGDPSKEIKRDIIDYLKGN
jgi:CDP-glucose 4,6-dehydratase